MRWVVPYIPYASRARISSCLDTNGVLHDLKMTMNHLLGLSDKQKVITLLASSAPGLEDLAIAPPALPPRLPTGGPYEPFFRLRLYLVALGDCQPVDIPVQTAACIISLP
jgi:hypothetical protein